MCPAPAQPTRSAGAEEIGRRGLGTPRPQPRARHHPSTAGAPGGAGRSAQAHRTGHPHGRSEPLAVPRANPCSGLWPCSGSVTSGLPRGGREDEGLETRERGRAHLPPCARDPSCCRGQGGYVPSAKSEGTGPAMSQGLPLLKPRCVFQGLMEPERTRTFFGYFTLF